MKSFDIRNTIVSLFINGFIKSLDYQSTLKLELKPKPEESVEERTKLRKQRLNEVTKNEKEINPELFRKHFKYSSPIDMYKNMNNLINTERNKTQTKSIKNALTDLKRGTENTPKDNANKIEENNKRIDIAENLKGQGLKILTADQMLSRLPISLAQLNAENNSEKLLSDNYSDNYCIPCIDQKNLQTKSIKVWLTLFHAWKLLL